MSTAVTTAPPATLASDESIASGMTNFVVFIWLAGIILFEKRFAYINVGGLFVTEFVLGLLIINNWRRFHLVDLLYLAILTAYVTVGYIKTGNILMVGKDMAWYYFLYFLRFFPRNFPPVYVRWIKRLLYFRCLELLLPTSIFPRNAYADGPILLFSFLWYLRDNNLRVSMSAWLFVVLLAVRTSFKTAVPAVVLLPVLLRLGPLVAALVTPGRALLASAGIITIIYFNLSGIVMEAIVHTISSLLQGVDGFESDTGTSGWRANIWRGAIQRTVNESTVWFGTMPGYNFMTDQYLGTKYFGSGGDQLGVLRSAHNILVQIIMKAGVAGLVVFLLTMFYWTRTMPWYVRISLAIVGLMAITGDILEVPSRGPLVYSLIVLVVQAARAAAPPAAAEVATESGRADTRNGAVQRPVGVPA